MSTHNKTISDPTPARTYLSSILSWVTIYDSPESVELTEFYFEIEFKTETVEGTLARMVEPSSGSNCAIWGFNPVFLSYGVKGIDPFTLKNMELKCRNYTARTGQGAAGSGVPLWARGLDAHRGLSPGTGLGGAPQS
ncbi:hypothetical protein FXO37_17637 [Capsicum annuum]|nr:hypothetical protein FXO37_17637 [Capsicum annuum]